MYTRNTIGRFIFASGLFISLFSVVSAQTGDLVTPPLDTRAFLGDAQYCFIEKGEIVVSLDQATKGARSGSTHIVSGTIKNRLNFPIFDGSIVVRIQKTTQTGTVGYAAVGDIVERFVAVRGINVLADSTTPFQFAWDVPRGITAGVYKVDVFLVSGSSLTLAGTESRGVPAASTLVSVDGNANQVSYLSTDSIRVDGTRLSVLGTSTTTTSARVSVDVLNTYTSSRDVVLEYRVYKSGLINEEDLEYSGAEIVSLKGGQKKNVSFVTKSGDSAIRSVLLELKDGDKSSFATFQMMNPKGVLSQIVFAGLSDFPLEKDVPVKVFGCAFISDATLSIGLSLVDTYTGTVLDLGILSGNKGMVSFSKEVIPAVSVPDSIDLVMNILDTQNQIRSHVNVGYACGTYGCNAVMPDISYRIFASIMLLLVGAIGLSVYASKKKKSVAQ